MTADRRRVVPSIGSHRESWNKLMSINKNKNLNKMNQILWLRTKTDQVYWSRKIRKILELVNILGKGEARFTKNKIMICVRYLLQILRFWRVTDRSIVLMRSWVLLVLYLIRRLWTNDVRHFLLVLYQWQLGKSLNTMPLAFSWNLPSIYSSDWLYHRLLSTLKYPLSRSMGKV